MELIIASAVVDKSRSQTASRILTELRDCRYPMRLPPDVSTGLAIAWSSYHDDIGWLRILEEGT